MHWMTCSKILKMLDMVCQLEWGRSGGVLSDGKQLNFPPFMVWRFREPNQELEKKIVEAVRSFKGNVQWEIYYSGRNWVLEPSRVRQFFKEGNYQVDSRARSDLSKLEPEFGQKANSDLPNLAEHIRRSIESLQLHRLD